VILRSEPQYYGTFAVFDYVKAQTKFLDEDEFRILQYIYNRSADVCEIAKETKINFRKCTKFLNLAVKLEFVKENDQSEIYPPERAKVDNKLFSKFSVPFLSAPSSVDVFITSKCNLQCVHCFSTKIESTELSMDEIKSILDQLEKNGVLEVRINGGEPLLHSNIDKALQMLGTRRFRKVLLTNGTLVTDSIAKQLKKSNITPTISLDDSNAQGHDLFRGVEGSFEKTLAGLKILQKNKVQYGINCCLHAKNLNRVNDIVALAVSCGASRISFLDLKRLGRMRNNEEWMPSQKEYQVAMAHIMMAKTMNKSIDVSLDAFLSCPVLREMILEAKRGYITCEAGRTRLSISSEGLVYPCNTVVGDSKWNMGNLRSENLTDVWNSKKWAFFRGAVKKSDLRNCRNCKDMKGCTDFYCRLLPYATTGDAFASSPKCGSS
jgi:radical SAM protein with 4Fe4S-binding SPASM domain